MSADEAKAKASQKIVSNTESMEILNNDEDIKEYSPENQGNQVKDDSVLTEQAPPIIIYQATNAHHLWGKCFWGLDIGSHNIKVVGLHKGLSTVSLVHVSVIEITPGRKQLGQGVKKDEATIAAILKALDALQNEHNLMATALDRDSVVIRQIQYPAAARDKLLSALQWEVRKYIPFKPDEVVVDAQIMGSSASKDKLDVLLVAATKEHLEQHMGLLEQVQIKSTMVDAAPLALMNVFLNKREPEIEETVVVLDLGAKATTLNILSRDGYYFTLSLSVGGERFTAEVQSQCQLDYPIAEALKRGEPLEAFSISSDKVEASFQKALEKSYELLVKEIRQALIYYNKQTGINQFDRLVLTGGGANLTGLDSYLLQKTGIPTEIFDPFKDVKVPSKYFDVEKVKAMGPQLAIAMGLAIRWKV